MSMKCPTINELPPPPPGKSGWPWTEDNPQVNGRMAGGLLARRISIVTPSYNQGKYLERTIRSILLQGYPNIEYIVIDGGSKDDSVSIIERYSQWLDYWVSEPDGGQTQAINKGLARSAGDIFAYLNSDDYYPPGALTAAAQLLWLSGNSWLAGACTFLDALGNELNSWHPRSPISDRACLIMAPWGAPQPSCFWKRELFESYGYFNESMQYTFDTEFQVRLVLNGELPLVVQRCFSYATLHDDCKTRRAIERFRMEEKSFIDVFWSFLSVPERVRACLWRFFLARDETGKRHRVAWEAWPYLLKAVSSSIRYTIKYTPGFMLKANLATLRRYL